MRRLPALAVTLLLVAAPASALADGDPASDILLGQDAFYPYAPNTVSKPYQSALNAMLVTSKKQGFGMKVALIAAESDLGSAPQLFNTPQEYANLLTQEISFNSHPRVLVVEPAGIGGNNLGDNAGPALRNVNVPSGATPDQLAQTAMLAIGKLTAAAGKPVVVPHVSVPAGSSKKKSSTSPLIVFGVPVLLVALAAAAARVRSRREEDDESADDDE